VSTDNIGLAKLAAGTTLVRIGRPQRPEFAAWRYGDQFGRRRQRALLAAGGGIVGVGALVAGGAAAGVAVGGFGFLFVQMGQALIHGRGDAVVARVRTAQHGIVDVRRRHLAESSLATDESGALRLGLRFKNGAAEFTGPEAERIASIVLPKVNRFGGKKAEVADAVRQIESVGDSERFLRHAGGTARVLIKSMTAGVSARKAKSRQMEFHKYGLFSLPAPQRLAIEMALHEEAERRALEGELTELERAWRDAEEVAAIADNLLVPPSVDEEFQRLKGELR
jgi:hypothetical protein